MTFQIPVWWNWKLTYSLVLLVLLVAICAWLGPAPAGSPAISASIAWGVVTLILSLLFMLGAAETPMQFLVFFGTGAFGAGMGYLVGAWLTPTGESNPLDQVRNIVAGVLTGVVGTKLLTLWDDLVDRPAGGGKPPIMTAPYFVPIVLWLVGFTVSLSAFYTVRIGQSGDVRITYTPKNEVLRLAPAHLGILPGTVVRFAGAANSPVDVTVNWEFRLAEPCGPPVPGAKVFDKTAFDKDMASAFDVSTGKLTAPAQPALQDWINSCPGSQNWLLTATSNQDHAKFSLYNVKLCRTKQDCPVTPAATPNPAPTGSAASGTTGISPAAEAPPNQTAPPLPKGSPENRDSDKAGRK